MTKKKARFRDRSNRPRDDRDRCNRDRIDQPDSRNLARGAKVSRRNIRLATTIAQADQQRDLMSDHQQPGVTGLDTPSRVAAAADQSEAADIAEGEAVIADRIRVAINFILTSSVDLQASDVDAVDICSRGVN
jgi:hypothetical protein